MDDYHLAGDLRISIFIQHVNIYVVHHVHSTSNRRIMPQHAPSQSKTFMWEPFSTGRDSARLMDDVAAKVFAKHIRGQMDETLGHLYMNYPSSEAEKYLKTCSEYDKKYLRRSNKAFLLHCANHYFK